MQIINNPLDEEQETLNISSVLSQRSPKKKINFIWLYMVIIAILIGLMVIFWPRQKQFELTSIQLPWPQLVEFEMNYKEAIDAKTQLIVRIENSIMHNECLNIKPMFHSFDFVEQVMYFTTFDELFLPDCLNDLNYKWSVSRENINVWNKHRQVTEWALNHVIQGDKVLYYRPEVYNLAEITILSKLVGPLGRVVTVGSPQLWKCMPHIRSLHFLPANIEYKEQIPFFSLDKYNIVIANDTVFKQNVNHRIADDSKMLIQSTDIDTLRTVFSSHKVQSFQLEEKECGRGVYGASNTAKSGFFSFTAADGAGSLLPERRVFRKSTADNKLLAVLEHEFLLYKLEYVKKEAAQVERLKLFEQRQICRSLDSSRQGEGFVVTTYGHKLHGVSVEQVKEWEGKREAVEWLRSKQAFLEVYYEVGLDFNLLAIVEIAHLVRDSTMHVVCSQEECEEIEQQCSKSRLSNVVTLHQSSTKQALLAGAVITDNETLIKELIASDYDKDHALLGHFTHTRNESLKAMREIYVRHRLKEVFIPQYTKQCIGFQFLHPFWNHTHPHSFYEITPSKYVVYSFWGGLPEKTPERKSFFMKNEMIADDVQFKMLTQQLFLFYETKEYPIHPAFYLLTSIQKSDFVRFYLMHVYGGGYADVKHYHFDWKPYFQRLEKDPVRMAYGYYGKQIHIACHDEEGLVPTCEELKKQCKNLIGNSQFVFKKDSPLTREWYNTAIKNLDNKLEALRQNPPQVPRQCYNAEFTRKDGTKFISKYPFRWAEISNEHLARAAYKYREYLATDMPYVIDRDYRVDTNLAQN